MFSVFAVFLQSEKYSESNASDRNICLLGEQEGNIGQELLSGYSLISPCNSAGCCCLGRVIIIGHFIPMMLMFQFLNHLFAHSCLKGFVIHSKNCIFSSCINTHSSSFLLSSLVILLRINFAISWPIIICSSLLAFIFILV